MAEMTDGVDYTVRLDLRISSTLSDALFDYCERIGLKRTDAVRQILTEYLQARGAFGENVGVAHEPEQA